ncbi:MAG: hypothetical protein MUF33_10955 [Candidatus Nanopelagicales bacterium]|jgi:hypothetical protein|nr:hypothetical protein [Candidatus Nanopelagicales bacterium]MCU0299020.1 hypothetical protein [Candidatus Nanopelagicales bacterium]
MREVFVRALYGQLCVLHLLGLHVLDLQPRSLLMRQLHRHVRQLLMH